MDDLIHLCKVDGIAGTDEDVTGRLRWLSAVLEKLGYAVASNEVHVDLYAMRMPASEPELLKGPIRLCTMDDLAAPGSSEERVLQRMELLADILHRLGWDMASGVAPDFHELWALRPEPPGLGDNGGAPEAGA